MEVRYFNLKNPKKRPFLPLSIDDDCHDNSDEQNCPGKNKTFIIF